MFPQSLIKLKYMESYNLASAVKKIYDSGICFFDIKSLNHILKIKKHSTFYFVLRQLISQKILIKIEKTSIS